MCRMCAMMYTSLVLNHSCMCRMHLLIYSSLSFVYKKSMLLFCAMCVIFCRLELTSRTMTCICRRNVKLHISFIDCPVCCVDGMLAPHFLHRLSCVCCRFPRGPPPQMQQRAMSEREREARGDRGDSEDAPKRAALISDKELRELDNIKIPNDGGWAGAQGEIDYRYALPGNTDQISYTIAYYRIAYHRIVSY
jgi:hypothetical protein